MVWEGEKREVTRTELMDIRERQWSKRLSVVSLAAEYPVDETSRIQTLEALGHLYKRANPAERARLLRRWPSVHVLSTIGVAVDHYEHGTFWPKLGSILGVTADQTFMKVWGEAFLANLKGLCLPTFEGSGDAGTKFVGRILMHSGMPTACLDDYFDLIGTRRSKIAGLGAAEFVSWAAARAEHGQLHNVDMPVARFLRYGGVFAADVTDRVFDLLDAVAAGGDGSDVPLPPRFGHVAVRLRASGSLHSVRQGSVPSHRADGDQRPKLMIDPFGQGVLLRLPAVGEVPDGSAVWVVGLDANTQRVATRALTPGLNEPAPQTDVPIPNPVRTATAALSERQDLLVILTVVDDQEPLLAFGEDGVLLPVGLPLPGRPTWLLFPGDPSTLEAGGAPVLSESPVPPGWAGWCLLLVDLEKASTISLAGGGFTRSVRTFASARVVTDEPVRGVRTSTGVPVISCIPEIVLPDELSEAAWEVTLLDGADEVVTRWSKDEDGPDPNSVWAAVPRPIVGTFTVRVRGPWGRGVTRTVKMVEGLDASFSPSWRRFADRGLQPCTAVLRADPGVEMPRANLSYREREVEDYVRVGAHGEYATLIVTPPHMTISHQSSQTTGAASVWPLRLVREAILEDPGTLILNTGESASPTLRFVVPAGVLQEVEPDAGRNGVYRFNLARIVDTLTANPQAKLALDPAGDVVVANIRPQRLFSGVESVDGVLEFEHCVNVEGMSALLYSTRAPWRSPAGVEVAGGRAEVPEWLRNAGPIRILLRIEDPWAPEPIPEWPSARRSSLVEADGFPVGDSPEETELSAFLAGEGGLPAEIKDFTRLWTVRALLGSLSLTTRTASVADAVEHAILADPRSALLALNSSGATSRAIPSLLIRTGLAWANLQEAHNDEVPPWTARGALPATLLAAADADWSEDEIEAATEICGPVVASLIRGEDPFASEGRFDDGAERFDKFPALRDAFVRQCGLVPQGLLSGDSRVIAAMALIKERHDPDLAFLTRNGRSICNEVETVILKLRNPAASAALRARQPLNAQHGWLFVPAISLGLALVARLAARGYPGAAALMDSKKRPWGDLAKVVPQIVTIDLIVAELLMASSIDSTQKRTS